MKLFITTTVCMLHVTVVCIMVPQVSGWSVTLPCSPLAFRCVPLTLSNLATHSFSRLFSSSSSVPTMKKAESQSNVKYNAPGSLVKRSSTFSQFPTEKSKTFDFLNEEWVPHTSLKRPFLSFLKQWVPPLNSILFFSKRPKAVLRINWSPLCLQEGPVQLPIT